jgi:hypothetical protein
MPTNDTASTRIAVNKYVISAVLTYLNSSNLRRIVCQNMNIDVLVSRRCESLHIRTTDGWISVTQAASYLKFDANEFIKSDQLRNCIGMFGSVISINPEHGDSDKSIVWMHPIGLLPMLFWIDTPAALELMASYFMSNATFMPNVDAMIPLIDKNLKLRSLAKAKLNNSLTSTSTLSTINE